MSSESAFAGEDCSGPEERSASKGRCGVVKEGGLRNWTGGFFEGVEGVRGGLGTQSLLGESRELADPVKTCALDVRFIVQSCFQTLCCTDVFDQQSRRTGH